MDARGQLDYSWKRNLYCYPLQSRGISLSYQNTSNLDRFNFIDWPRFVNGIEFYFVSEI
jgi:hypothetical protein